MRLNLPRSARFSSPFAKTTLHTTQKSRPVIRAALPLAQQSIIVGRVNADCLGQVGHARCLRR
jgi:hypothetical protein